VSTVSDFLTGDRRLLVGGKNSKEKIENNKKTNNEKKIGLG
jgi:hypothetical protein